MTRSDDHPHLTPLARLAAQGGWRLALPHCDQSARLLWLPRGHGQALLAGARVSIAPNTILFIPADTLFALDMPAPLFGTALIVPPDSDVPLPQDPHRLILREARQQSDLVALIEAMSREQADRRDFHGQAARAHATLISIWLRRALLAAPAPSALRADQRLARDFATLLCRDYRAGRKMATYAGKLGITGTHLTRACNRAAGQSAAHLIAGRVLHAARVLLADTDHSIMRIAGQLGFKSASHFSRFIQNHTGKPPSALRAKSPRRTINPPAP